MTPGLPPMPGEGIVPQAPQVTFAQPAPAVTQPPPTTQHRHGIIGRLLGIQHAEEMADKATRVRFYMDSLHDALSNPNSRVPREQIIDWGNKLAEEVNHPNHPEVAKLIKQDVNNRLVAREAGNKLQYVNQTQAQANQPVAPPVPAQAPAQPLPPPTNSAIDNLPWSPQNVALRAQNRPPGIPTPPIPFDEGGQGGGSAPPANIPPPVRASSVAGTTDFGTVPRTGMAWGVMTPQQVGQDLAAREEPTKQMEERVKLAGDEARYQALKARYQKEEWFKNLPAMAQAEVLTGARIGMGSHIAVAGIVKSKPGDVGLDGQPVEPDQLGKYYIINGVQVFTPTEQRQTFQTRLNPNGTIDKVAVNPYAPSTPGVVNPTLTSAAKVARMIKVTHPDGSTSEIGIGPTGQLMTDDPRLRGVNPAMLPTTSNHFQLVEQPNGDKALVPITTVSGKGGVGTAAATPTAAAAGGTATAKKGPAARVGEPIVVGGKSLTPGQRISLEGKAKVFDNTLELAQSVKSKLSLLDNLVDAKKLDLQLDPHQGIIKALINRNVPMSAEETALAGDFISLMEHINTLRGPLSATGFRGPEAFNALQAQRGQLMANPAVSRRVLENTIKALIGQRDAIRNGLSGKGKLPAWTAMEPPATEITAPPKKSLDEFWNK